MTADLVIANLDRGGAAMMGALLAIALLGGLVFLVRGRMRSADDAASEPQARSERPGPPPWMSAIRPKATVAADDRPRPLPAAFAPPSRDPVVRVSGLSKRYGEVRAVDDVTFSLEAGTVTGYLGPNGAGKTTTLRVLLGLAEPSAGEALVFGRRYRDLEEAIRRVGAVLESNDFHPTRSGRDHLRALALAAGLPLSRVEQVLELVELSGAAKRRVKTYSLGMRQRLGLAAALLGDPKLLILDEPANGLDPAGVRWLRTFLQGFAAQGRTVLVSSHLLAEVAQTVDRVLIIDHGRLLASGRLDQLTDAGRRSLEDVYLELTGGEAS